MTIEGVSKEILQLITTQNMAKKGLAFSFSSWFCIPNQGMKDFDILCRASCFLVPALGMKNNKFHMLTVAHAAAPWKYPKLYPQEWLRYVNEEHVIFTFEPRTKDGSFLSQLDLKSEVFIHPTRDLAVLHLELEERDISFLQKNFNNLFDLSLQLTDDKPDDTEELSFHGHDMTLTSKEASSAVPLIAQGKFAGRSQTQVLYKTHPVLVDGLCGGPVTKPFQIRDSDGYRKIVRGMVEGIVPANYPVEDLRNAAVFVESEEIRQFLRQIEAGEVKSITTGIVAKIVGMDQDSDKMDLKKIL